MIHEVTVHALQSYTLHVEAPDRVAAENAGLQVWRRLSEDELAPHPRRFPHRGISRTNGAEQWSEW
jgi:hypothetical protein